MVFECHVAVRAAQSARLPESLKGQPAEAAPLGDARRSVSSRALVPICARNPASGASAKRLAGLEALVRRTPLTEVDDRRISLFSICVRCTTASPSPQLSHVIRDGASQPTNHSRLAASPRRDPRSSRSRTPVPEEQDPVGSPAELAGYVVTRTIASPRSARRRKRRSCSCWLVRVIQVTGSARRRGAPRARLPAPGRQRPAAARPPRAGGARVPSRSARPTASRSSAGLDRSPCRESGACLRSSSGIITFSSAVNSRRRWWNWKTNPISRFRTAASPSSSSPIKSSIRRRRRPPIGGGVEGPDDVQQGGLSGTRGAR